MRRHTAAQHLRHTVMPMRRHADAWKYGTADQRRYADAPIYPEQRRCAETPYYGTADQSGRRYTDEWDDHTPEDGDADHCMSTSGDRHRRGESPDYDDTDQWRRRYAALRREMDTDNGDSPRRHRTPEQFRDDERDARRRSRSKSGSRSPNKGEVKKMKQAVILLGEKMPNKTLVSAFRSPTRPDLDKTDQEASALPPHRMMTGWYDLAKKSLEKTQADKDSPFIPTFLKKSQSIYHPGRDNFLSGPRKNPKFFHKVSAYQKYDPKTSASTQAMSMSARSVTAVEKSLRFGLSAASYEAHFRDGMTSTLEKLKTDIEAITAPSTSTSATQKQVTQLKAKAQGTLATAVSFGNMAQSSAVDTMGALVAVDVNMVLNVRDKLNEKLDTFLSHHAVVLRHGPFMDLDLMPNLDHVVDEAPKDAQVAQTRHFAHYGAKLSSGRRANAGRGGVNNPDRRRDYRPGPSNSSRTPFRGRGRARSRPRGGGGGGSRGRGRGGAGRGRGSSTPAAQSSK